jgi:hypothetical protein
VLPDPWSFDQPPNAAAITLRRIIKPSIIPPSDVLFVSHDEDDHGWQFLDGGPVTPEDGAIVGMGTMLMHDASLVEIADLPPGWIATRAKIG